MRADPSIALLPAISSSPMKPWPPDQARPPNRPFTDQRTGAMLLVADVGNTNTKIGVFDGSELVASWRLTSRREQTPDEYGLFIETLLRTRGLDRRRIDAIAISNVVPPVQQTLEWMCEQYFGVAAYFVDPAVESP